ncbi:crotonase/enoyl-CoA hydratase family protein [Acinetobacter larvae]|uniref:Enoyl-CoA hydratase n=1 Tax=Acinetobacter larvae TaxID=1789224 RepID=A0A1B2M204_9GAMM|nr:crotonase/enoyl-CoA hydratase family protein [Acinetobacter larvae]AOA59181.1 enoyl-CoA hydratase [Acinetobacter larvae]
MATNASEQLVTLEKQGGLAIVTLNRAEKRNALSFAMLQQLIATARKIQKDRSIRCVILTGSHQVFSAGIDLSDLNDPKNRLYAAWELLRPGQNLFQKACLIWQQLPVPVIAAIDGYCFGAGMQLALGTDIRIVHPNTQLSIMESRWGLVPDMGLSRSLKALIGQDLAKELTFTARVFDGAYAQNIGLMTHSDEQPLERAKQLAEEIMTRSPDAVLAAKRVLDAMIHKSATCALALEKIWQFKLLAGKNSQLARKIDKDPSIQFRPRQYR